MIYFYYYFTASLSLTELNVAGGRDRSRSSKNPGGKQIWSIQLRPLFAALEKNTTLKELGELYIFFICSSFVLCCVCFVVCCV